MGGQARMRVARRQGRELLTQCKVLKYVRGEIEYSNSGLAATPSAIAT
jgi:hypothetical protein